MNRKHRVFPLMLIVFITALMLLIVPRPGNAAGMSPVWTWGANYSGQMGIGSPDGIRDYPANIIGLSGIVAVSTTNEHTLALRADGTLWAWGENSSGQLGDGTVINRDTPVQVTGISDIVDFAAGGRHSLVLKRDGTVWGWGANDQGQLGTGTTDQGPVMTPVQVSGLTDVVAIVAGNIHSLALKKDGTVWAWGFNFYGELGNNTPEAYYLSTIPVQVLGLTTVKTIVSGGHHSFAILNNGAVWAWGQNNYGQIGDGTTENAYAPVPVPGMTNVSSIAVNLYHTLALKNDGTVWAWGQNNDRKLGDGTTIDRASPVLVTILPFQPTAVAAGAFSSLALNPDGTVWAWGTNAYGQLGDGSYINPTGLVQTQTLTGVKTIHAGMVHALALTGGSISGTVIYNGSQAGSILVGAWATSNGCSSGQPPSYYVTLYAPGPYTIFPLQDGIYYVGAVMTPDGTITTTNPWGMNGGVLIRSRW